MAPSLLKKIRFGHNSRSKTPLGGFGQLQKHFWALFMFQNLVTLPIFFSPKNPGKLICNVIMVGHKRRLIVKLRSSRFSCYTSQWGAFNSFLDSFKPRNNKAVKFFLNITANRREITIDSINCKLPHNND